MLDPVADILQSLVDHLDETIPEEVIDECESRLLPTLDLLDNLPVTFDDTVAEEEEEEEYF